MRLMSSRQRSLAIVPGVAVGVVPSCPLCWPIYAGLMSFVGLGFLLETKYLLPLSAADPRGATCGCAAAGSLASTQDEGSRSEV